jgi:CBS domain-containing protein
MSSLRPFDHTPVECANRPVSNDARDGQHTDVGIMPFVKRQPRPMTRRPTTSIQSTAWTRWSSVTMSSTSGTPEFPSGATSLDSCVLEGRVQGQIDGIALERAPSCESTIADVYTRDVASVVPTDSVGDAVRRMKSSDVRRMPVVESGRAIGIVSLGDIEVETRPGSPLADISTAAPDR